MEKQNNVPVQSLIDHIKTALDVDPWAKEMAEDLLSKNIPAKVHGEKYCRCHRCGAMLFEGNVYCAHCGQMIDWEFR